MSSPNKKDKVSRSSIDKAKTIGSNGVKLFTTWDRRADMRLDGMHAMPSAGIHGSEERGAYAIVLSGGYESDKDDGDVIIYTGSGGLEKTEGGWSPANARQVADQEYTRGNKSLAVSLRDHNPVRVIRGHTSDSDWAPITGYRYDGEYTVVKYDHKPGREGFMIILFTLKRNDGQPPIPRRSGTASTSARASTSATVSSPSGPKFARGLSTGVIDISDDEDDKPTSGSARDWSHGVIDLTCDSDDDRELLLDQAQIASSVIDIPDSDDELR